MDTSTKTVTPPKSEAAPLGGTWMIMLDGILLILLGVFLVIPSETAHDMLIRGLGILLCATAIAVGARLWMSSAARKIGPVAWLACIIPFVIGIVLLVWPQQSLEAIAVTVGVVVLIRGVIETAIALSNRHHRGWEVVLARGLVTIALGIFFMAFSKLGGLPAADPARHRPHRAWCDGRLHGPATPQEGVADRSLALRSQYTRARRRAASGGSMASSCSHCRRAPIMLPLPRCALPSQ